MAALQWLVYGIALFFAGTWTFAVMFRPAGQLKSTLVTLPYWWIGIAMAIAGLIGPFHLLWFMPVALAVPAIAMTTMVSRGGPVSTSRVFFISTIPLGAALFLVAVAIAQDAEGCATDGDEVMLAGHLERETFPGPPNYLSVRDGDAAEVFWVLIVPSPICFFRLNFELGAAEEVPIRGLERLQLVMDQEEYTENAALVGREVHVRGQIFSGINAHHRTQALIDVLEMVEM